MKTLNTIFIVLTLIFVSNSYAQTQPDKKTTKEYLEKVFVSTYNFELKRSGVDYKITGYFNGFEFYNTSDFKYSMTSLTDGYCSLGYEFYKINWAKMESIADWDGVAIDSPVSVLFIKFPNNSILRDGRIDINCNKEGFSRYGTTQSVSYVLFPYLNQEGVRERLVKALNHLSKLEKEEQAKNDPFGN